jgi:hypothetical protein
VTTHIELSLSGIRTIVPLQTLEVYEGPEAEAYVWQEDKWEAIDETYASLRERLANNGALIGYYNGGGR